ncbi:hypothetical protein CH58_4017 [Yersinia pestis Antiqua]|nr:hypothetical protein CH58_4017 [Yersinia pestis Antiqua]
MQGSWPLYALPVLSAAGTLSTTSNARQLNMTGIRGLHHHRVKMAFKVNQTMALLTQNDLCDVYLSFVPVQSPPPNWLRYLVTTAGRADRHSRYPN